MLRLVLKDGSAVWAPENLLEKFSLFRDRPSLLHADHYAIASNVNQDIVNLLILRASGKQTSQKVTRAIAFPLRQLCDEFGFSGLDGEIAAVLDSNDVCQDNVLDLKARVDGHDAILLQMQRQILALERQLRSATALAFGTLEKRLAETDGKLRDEVRRIDADVRTKASAADVEALAGELASLKEAEMNQSKRCFEFDEKAPLNGIIANLTRECSGKVKKFVAVTSSGTQRKSSPENVVDLESLRGFETEDVPDSWICYFFKGRYVEPVCYSIRAWGYNSPPQSWVLEGSNDGSKDSWVVIDRRDECKVLTARDAVANFQIPRESTGRYRYLRIRQTAPNLRGTHVLVISALEIFGSIYG